jgi:hypothetical protein
MKTSKNYLSCSKNQQCTNTNTHPNDTKLIPYIQCREETQDQFQQIINTLSTCIEKICIHDNSPPTFSRRALKHGDFLPRKQCFYIYHSIRKTKRIIHTPPQQPPGPTSNDSTLYNTHPSHLPPWTTQPLMHG